MVASGMVSCRAAVDRKFRQVSRRAGRYGGPNETRGLRTATTSTGETTMASIHKETRIDARPEDVWSALRDVGALHTRLVPGFVVDTRLEDGARIVTFGNGMVARELIVALDDERRRLVWSVVGGRFSHHNASAQVFSHDGGTRFVWIADLLPDEIAGDIRKLMEQGLSVLKKTMERS